MDQASRRKTPISRCQFAPAHLSWRKLDCCRAKAPPRFTARSNHLRWSFRRSSSNAARGFVENGNLATAGGLSSGIDLALRVVERYFGREVAQKTAYNWNIRAKAG